jgi:2-dehydro-3-deoxygluconokinase
MVDTRPDSNTPLDLIALGETMAALAPPAGQTLRTAAQLALDHAGAESNTCIGLSRLGLRSAWVSRLGADTLGDRIVAALETENVATSWVRRDPLRPTGLMVKDPGGAGVRYYRSESAASRLSVDDLDGVPIERAGAVLVTGVTALIGSGPQEAGLALLTRARGRRIVDPNLRRGLWGSDRRVELVRPLVDRCDLLLAGDAELAELLGAGDHDARALARLAAARGPREIVVRADTGVGVLDPDGSWHSLLIHRTSSVDPIGAGDAFNAGYIAVRLRSGSIEDALALGAKCGAAVTTSVSDTANFPRS